MVLAPADTSICAQTFLSMLGIFAIIQFAICSSSFRFWSITGIASIAPTFLAISISILYFTIDFTEGLPCESGNPALLADWSGDQDLRSFLTRSIVFGMRIGKSALASVGSPP